MTKSKSCMLKLNQISQKANKPERTNRQVRSSRHKTFQKTNKKTIQDTPNTSLNIYGIDPFNKPSYYPNPLRQSLSPPKSYCIKKKPNNILQISK